MPYSVPPPPPPVVDFRPAEESRAVLSSLAASTHPSAPESSAVAPAASAPVAHASAATAAELGEPLQRGIAQPDLPNTAPNSASAPPPSFPSPSSAASSLPSEYGSSVIPDLQPIASSPASHWAGQSVAPPQPASPEPLVRPSFRSSQAGAELNQSPDPPSEQSLPFPPSVAPTLPETQPSPNPEPPSSNSTPNSTPVPLPAAPEQLPNAPADGTPTAPPADGQILRIPGQGEGTDTPEQTPPGQIPPGQAPAPRTPRGNSPPVDQEAAAEVIELNADRQEFNQLQQVFTAEGNAVMRFRQAVLSADRIQVNLPNRIAVAEGNVTLTQGQQVLQGNRFEYNFVQGDGSIFGAGGQIDVAATEQDFAPTPSNNQSNNQANNQATLPNPTVSTGDQIRADQPLQVLGSPGGITFGVSGGNQTNVQGARGDVNRLRYEAERVDFTPDGWVGTNVRITNDPFSPPELEIRSPRVTFRRISQTASELRARNPRVVFDQGLSLPLLRDRIVFDNREREPGLVQFGFDERDRGGFFIERPFEVLNTPVVRFSLTPQLLVQRAYDNGNFFDGSSFGLRSRLDANLGRNTSLTGEAVLTSLDLSEVEDNLRASLRARQRIGDHTLALEYSYRDRLFNGSLGFQTVQSSLGFVVTSPDIVLGNTGINLSYQGGIQFINADTDRLDLLEPIRDNNRIDLTRYQASAAVSRPFYLWIGTPLPPTATEGLRYTPNPIVPYVALSPEVRGVYSAYSNGDIQASLRGILTLSGQFGHFSRDFFDYTAFRVSYSETAREGESPFRFDRLEDERVLTLGLTQQIFGPFTFGIQTSLNLEDDRTIDTIYTLEYNRRTYAVSLNFSPIREAAALTLRVSDFNWFGNPGRFSGLDDDTVTDGVDQRDD
ncbi:DUF3769 domain-containing protein [Phormidium tenue FACHB-886]|nr:DUF3769 domain-containing protein [Phormidium tenue FACHB-886]